MNKGPDRMIFSAPRCDKDIKNQMNETASVIDPTPMVPLNKAWSMRPR